MQPVEAVGKGFELSSVVVLPLGWSSEGNYNDLFAYDLENRDWFGST